MSDEVPNSGAVSTVMRNVLDSVIAVYEADGSSLPERRYIAVGEVAHDCEQLTVSFVQLYVGAPGAEADTPQRCNTPRSVVLQVQLVRAIPTVSRSRPVPSVDDIEAATEALTADASLVMDGALASEAANWLGALADVSVTPPSGGFQAVQLNLVCGVM